MWAEAPAGASGRCIETGVGATLGCDVGVDVSRCVGARLGALVGCGDDAGLGSGLGNCDGVGVGCGVGKRMGIDVGTSVGADVGCTYTKKVAAALTSSEGLPARKPAACGFRLGIGPKLFVSFNSQYYINGTKNETKLAILFK